MKGKNPNPWLIQPTSSNGSVLIGGEVIRAVLRVEGIWPVATRGEDLIFTLSASGLANLMRKKHYNVTMTQTHKEGES